MSSTEEQEKTASNKQGNPIDKKYFKSAEALTNERRTIENLYENSSFFKTKHEFRTLQSEELQIGEKLGEGGFCEVREVKVLRKSLQQKTLAVKYLKRESMENDELYERGAADLVTEANFLAKLDHKNIVKLYGISEPNETKTFLVLDRLHDILDNRIKQWREGKGFAQQRKSHVGFFLFGKKEDPNEKKLTELKERLKVALAIAEALEYLHSMNIIHRDIKPDNIGFDGDENVLLIDFGLAKELKDATKLENGKYQLTGNTGLWRYMAPEVAKNWAYNRSVDTYSFGMLLWEICALERPFAEYTEEEHKEKVVNGDERPEIARWWPVELQWLLKKCWGYFPAGRPTFDVIRDTLQDVIYEKPNLNAEQSIHRDSSKSHQSLELPTAKSKGDVVGRGARLVQSNRPNRRYGLQG